MSNTKALGAMLGAADLRIVRFAINKITEWGCGDTHVEQAAALQISRDTWHRWRIMIGAAQQRIDASPQWIVEGCSEVGVWEWQSIALTRDQAIFDNEADAQALVRLFCHRLRCETPVRCRRLVPERVAKIENG